MTFRLFTTTKFRVYKNCGGRFVPLFKNGSTWDHFTELGTMVTRASRANAEKFIQRKADRLFYGQAPIEYVEAGKPQENTPVNEEGAVRAFDDLTPREQVDALTRLLANPHFPNENRPKVIKMRSRILATL